MRDAEDTMRKWKPDEVRIMTRKQGHIPSRPEPQVSRSDCVANFVPAEARRGEVEQVGAIITVTTDGPQSASHAFLATMLLTVPDTVYYHVS
jgi:hypothetical protein